MRRPGMTGKQLEFTSFYADAKDRCMRIVLAVNTDLTASLLETVPFLAGVDGFCCDDVG